VPSIPECTATELAVTLRLIDTASLALMVNPTVLARERSR
jgi:hypothetical protein